jgi:hypothetical protein
VEHGETREKVLVHQCEELTLIYERLLELFWVGGGHSAEEGSESPLMSPRWGGVNRRL